LQTVLNEIQMRHIAAYLLCQIGGNASPSASDVQKVLSAVGIEADEERLDKLISELEGKDIGSLIAEGNSKLSSVRLNSILSKYTMLTQVNGIGSFWWCCRCCCTCRWWWRWSRRCCREGGGEEGRGEGEPSAA